ncbi:MAG: cyclic pyranopterin monophosphate synthase MoaC [Candidatus Rokuibacteriota bacterium]|nr:MAG: cyclic pyranopterin monophosphate synthase MoaC [Candidatus Rokubacteria bacterium]
MAHQRAEEAEADGQRPDGGDHPARSIRRHRLTTARRAQSYRGLSHLSAKGDARMVDVSEKRETVREAVARAILRMKPATLRVIRQGNAPKGDVLGVARTAGILAAKRTPQLIPLCHPLRITGVDVTFSDDLKRGELTVEARVRTVDKTGVEMEALTAAAVAALTVYDMVKAVERGVTIARVQLVEKLGGKSGHWRR